MKSKENTVTQVLSHAVCTIFSLSAILPLLLLVIASFTKNSWAVTNGFSFFPKELSLSAYTYISSQWALIGRGYLNTILVTFAGTAIGLTFSTLFAYGISHSEIPGMKLVSFLLVFSMLFNGGLVSTYYTYINIFPVKDTFWAQVIPNLMMNAFNVILIRNYFTNSIPPSLREAAKIDGASEYRILAKIIIPLSKPILATVGLFTALAYWNDWTNGLYYLSQRKGSQYFTIQNILNNINDNIQVILQNASTMSKMGTSVADLPSTTVRMAIAVIGLLPILILYPFFQKYFVKGITLGGVKE